MKRIWALFCAGMLVLGMAGCGGKDDGKQEGGQTQGSAGAGQETAGTPDSGQQEDPSESHNYEEGWTEEMEKIKQAVVDNLGEDYWPNTAMTPDMMESLLGITPDMYEDYFAEMPAINVNVDMLVVVKAAADKADAVEEALLAYYDRNVSDTMQYPQNVGKIQAARVERIGSYVIFAQLGADTTAVSEEGDNEVIIAHCQEVNDLVIEIISNLIEH